MLHYELGADEELEDTPHDACPCKSPSSAILPLPAYRDQNRESTLYFLKRRYNAPCSRKDSRT